MTADVAFFQLFERLSPLLASGHAKFALVLDHEIVVRGEWPSRDASRLSLALANALPSVQRRNERAGIIIETPDNISHFVRIA